MLVLKEAVVIEENLLMVLVQLLVLKLLAVGLLSVALVLGHPTSHWFFFKHRQGL